MLFIAIAATSATLVCAVLAAVVLAQRSRLASTASPEVVAELRARLALAPDPAAVGVLEVRLARAEAALGAAADPAALAEARSALATSRAEAASAAERAQVLAADVTALRAELLAAQEKTAEARAAHASLASALEAEREKVAALDGAEGRLADTFAALSAQALERSGTSFLQLAEQHLTRSRAAGVAELDARTTAVAGLVGPVAEALSQVQEKMQRLEVSRAEADATVVAQVKALQQAQQELRAETANLVTALRAPQVRGRWGELQLRRVVEVAGMVRHCDFDEQVSIAGPDGGLRPDLVVRLPGGKTVVVDAKVPLQGFLQAVDATDEPTRQRRLADHARQVRAHIDALAAKRYQDAFELAPDVVVLFVPGDAILSAAAEADASLWEHAAQKRVLLAGPTSLIGLLHVISHGWKQEAVAEHARQIATLGRELYKRLGLLGEHLDRTGRALDKAVEGYNGAIGSLEARVFVTARKLADLEIAEGDLPTPAMVDRTTRPLAAPELTPAPGLHRPDAVA